MTYFLIGTWSLLMVLFGHHWSKIFQSLCDYDHVEGLHCHCRFDELDVVSRSQVCKKTQNGIKTKKSDSLLLLLDVECLLYIVKRSCRIWFVQLWCVFTEIINMFLVGELSGLFRTVTFGVFSNSTLVIKVKVCMIILLINLYLFMPISMTLTVFQGYSSVKHCNWKCYVLIWLIWNL